MNKLTTIISAAIILFTVVSCEKEFDQPPVPVIPIGESITIETIRSTFPSGDTLFFEENTTLTANVSADEASGNLYREVYIDDGTNAIILRLDNPGGLDRGDRILINLTNLVVTEFAGTMQLGEANAVDDIIILGNNEFVAPAPVTIAEVIGNPEAYEAKLLSFEDVEFSSADLGSTYANPDATPSPQSLNKTLTDCDGNEITVRNSGFANFAGQTIPNGNGSFEGVLSEFNGEYQLKINDVDAIAFDGTRCDDIIVVPPDGVYLQQDFSSNNIFNGGWTTQVVEGSFSWETSSQGGPDNAPYAVMSNWNGSNNSASEAWLISPSIDLSDAMAPKLNFISATAFDGDEMEVYISTDYDGSSAPGSANWTPIDPTLATNVDFFTWTPSGDVDLSSYLQDGVYLGFRYTGSDADGATWEIDDVFVGE